MTEVDKIVEAFAEEATLRAKRNLGSYRYVKDKRGRKKRRRADSSGELRNSLTFNIKKGQGTYDIAFFANGEASKYASFVEQGVNGTKKKWGSPFSFKGKNINQDAIRKWMKKKPIRVREFKNGKLGGFAKATETRKKQTAFLIGRSIAMYGISPLNYMSDAVNEELPKWRERFSEALAKDLENRIQ